MFRSMFDLRATILGGPLAVLLGIVALVVLFGDDGVAQYGAFSQFVRVDSISDGGRVIADSATTNPETPETGAEALQATHPPPPAAHRKRHLGPPPSPTPAEGE